jgi:hypothetical protein
MAPSQPAVDPFPEVEWQLWYRDLFDRDCPPSVEIRGRGLIAGLIELWARHLFETVRPDGRLGFSRFNLWSESRSITIEGDPAGAARLRGWLFGTQEHTQRGYVAAADPDLLSLLATTHASLLAAGLTSAPILLAAAASPDRPTFETRLATLPSS